MDGQAIKQDQDTPIERMLSQQQKDVLRLRYVARLSITETAINLNISSRMVSFETARAFRAIRLCRIRYGIVHLDFLQD